MDVYWYNVQCLHLLYKLAALIHDATRNFMEDKWREMHGCSMHWILLLVGINEIYRISKQNKAILILQ